MYYEPRKLVNYTRHRIKSSETRLFTPWVNPRHIGLPRIGKTRTACKIFLRNHFRKQSIGRPRRR